MLLKITRKTSDGPVFDIVVDSVRVNPRTLEGSPHLTIDAQDVNADGCPSGRYVYRADLHLVTNVELVHDHDPADGSRVANEIRG